MDPQLRGSFGGGGHARRHSRAPSISGGGVAVGRGAVLARHRRAPSRSLADALRSPSDSMRRQSSRGALEGAVSIDRLPSLAEQEQLPPPACGGSGGFAASAKQPQQPQQQGLAALALHALSAPLALLAALLGWVLGAAAAAARAARANGGLALGLLIIALQAAMLLDQRQQLAALRQHLALPPLDGAAGAGGAGPAAWPGSAAQAAQAAQAAAALGREVAHLQRTLAQLAAAGDSWRGSLERALGQAADLAGRLQQHAVAGAGPGVP